MTLSKKQTALRTHKATPRYLCCTFLILIIRYEPDVHEVLTKSIETLKTLRLFQFLRWSSCRTSWSGRPPALTWPWSVLRRRTLGPSTTGCTKGACSCPRPSTPWLLTSTATGPGCASPSTTSPRETSATTGVSPRTLWGRPRDPSGCTVSSVYNFTHTVLLLTASIVIKYSFWVLW